ncbi:MAG: FAD binding domain-containing protein [Candidatus Dormibacterales bacterium]
MSAGQFLEPKSIKAAVALMQKHGPSASVLAGGTDLVVHARSRKQNLPAPLVHLGRVAGLQRVSVDAGGRLHLGAMVTHAKIEASRKIAAGWPALVDASTIVGSPATRNVGTVGGNLCNGSPAMEIGAPLLVYGAEVAIAGASGVRVVALSEFLIGPGRTARRPDEILTEVVVPPAGAWHGSAYIRLGFRLAMEIAVVGAAAAVRLDSNGKVEDCRIALTAVAPTVIRATAAEHALIGSDPSEGTLKRVGEESLAAARPIDDVRAPASYRLETIAVITRRTVELALQRAHARLGGR